ncbi:ABC transporter permease [uncultured Paludibaculum sp.]|uniref:ABC transporter permease n=1 Tax=uncultured Paludibaculum sp. TaxID=1765020 RepID=UPI002AAB88D5|nr:ABC transporter permease [uncultured Paludibaculum sp.]
MQTLLQDLRYAFRTLLKSRGFAVTAALTLAAGIGANTAIFSIMDAVLLRPLPYPNPDRLVRLYETEAAPGKYPFTGPDFLDWKTQNSTFSDMTLYFWPTDMNLSGHGQPDPVRVVPTESNFFSLLGVSPLLGRTWAVGEDQPGKDDVVILGYALWQSRFGGDPKAVGQVLELNARKYTVVGVMPEGFNFPFEARLWTPLDMSGRGLGERGSHSFNAIGRMKPGVAVEKARADVALIAARLEKAFPDSNHKVGAVVVPLQEDLAGKSRTSLLMMLGAVGLVLLIACANIANLLLSRAVSRQKEMAVRSSLGASRLRLLRQMLTESLLLSLVGGALGVLLGWGLITLLPKIKSFTLPSFNKIELSASVLLFAFGLTVVTGVLFGLAPAFQASRPDLFDELKGGAGSSISPGRRRRLMSNGLVVGEIALSMILLICAGLLLKDFARVRGVEIGVRRDGIWTGAIQLPEAIYKTDPQRAAFARQLLEQARGIPGVQVASLSDRLPLEGGSNYYVQIRGKVSQRMSGPLVESHRVTPDYFRTMGIPLLKGRLPTETDTRHAMELDTIRREAWEKGTRLPAAQRNQMVYANVINATMARTLWPGEDPVGQMFAGGGGDENGPWRQVVGVVGDVRQWGLTEKPQPEAYDALYAPERVFLTLHTSVPSSSIAPAVRRALAGIDANLALYRERTIAEVVDDNSRGQRFLSSLVGSFAALAALLAAIGIYGVLSYVVTQRTHEIGIRMSLGATRTRVLGDVLRQGMSLAFAGFALGLVGAFAAGRVMESLLHEVKPRDPVIFAGTAALLAVVTLLACLLPARRAARLDPIRALRYE